MKSDIIICSCGSTDHQIVLHYDEDDKLVYCHIHLVSRPFLKRLWYGIKYIFGYKCRFGHWDEFLFDSENVEKLQEVVNLLKEK